MNKQCLVAIIATCISITASAQTLFTYGKFSADAKDFLRTYKKNNVQPVADKARAMSEYLELYINSRLKIREAYERRYDTLPHIKSEVNNLRAQIVDNYMTDPGIADRLGKEAFDRSQKDIHAAHIFISAKNAAGDLDTVTARQKIDAIIKRLQKGEDFLRVAEQASEDPSAKTNKGDLGYITVFSLPYEFESIVYSIPVNKYSAPYRSRQGYHIFKNLGERKAVGKIIARQILLAIPPDADDALKKQIGSRADSLYRLIMKGESFETLAATYSNDYISANNGGKMPEIGVGQYDPVFERTLWGLPKDGAVSKPFRTTHGYHILKRISVKPIVNDRNNKAYQQELQQKISADGRWKTSRDFIYERVNKKPGVKKHGYNDAALWAFSDSLLSMKTLGIGNGITRETPLFTIGDTTINAGSWINYAQVYRYKQDGSGIKTYPQIMEEFIQSASYNYYRDHLEDYNDDFRYQMEEFRDGNLFFEIMQSEIWNRGQSDSVALLALYEKNKSSYNWKSSADAVIFFCSDQSTANMLYEQIKKDPANWKKISAVFAEKVAADSSRYEWEQIPNLNKTIPKPGMILPPLVNSGDNTAAFAYIVNVYPQPMPRTFNEARGLVINDYQVGLEAEWIKSLRKKYPVTIDKKVLAAISK